jgi:hypothetical protein
MVNELISFLQKARVGRPEEKPPFLEALGIADLVASKPQPEQAPRAEAAAGGGRPGAAPATVAAPGGGGPGAPVETAATSATVDGTQAMTPAASSRQVVGAAGTAPTMPRGFKVPKAEELADAWHDIRIMTASNPEAYKRYAPQLDAIQGLAIARHRQAFKGDPIENPVDYARHMGSIAGRFGEPMAASEAGKWQQYMEGERGAALGRAKKALTEGNLPQINRDIEALLGPGWRATGVEQGAAAVGGLELPAYIVTFTGPNGERQQVNSVDFELGQANLETRLRVAEANRKAEEAKGGEKTRELTQANAEKQAMITGRALDAQLANPQGAAGAPADLTDREKIRHEAYYKERLEIIKGDASPEVKQRMLEELAQDYSDVVGGGGAPGQATGLSPEGATLFGLEGQGAAPAAGGTAGAGGAPGAPPAARVEPTGPLSERIQGEQQAAQAARTQARERQGRQEQREAILGRLEQTWTEVRQNDEQRQAAIAELDRLHQEAAGSLSASERQRMERLMRLLTVR